jgi:hypothetical protein
MKGESMTANEIMELLRTVPDKIFDVDVELARSCAHLDELKDSLSISELNVELAVEMPAKSNEDTRKNLRAEAVSKSPDVKRIKALIRDEHIRQSGIENERSKNTRTFSAALAMAELAAAQLNAVAARTRKETVTHEQH